MITPNGQHSSRLQPYGSNSAPSPSIKGNLSSPSMAFKNPTDTPQRDPVLGERASRGLRVRAPAGQLRAKRVNWAQFRQGGPAGYLLSIRQAGNLLEGNHG
ncbi:hypothetical protein ACLOJK_003316 [Asimina triloba]